MTRDKIANWPHDKLTVMAEQSAVFYDLMTPELVEQVLNIPLSPICLLSDALTPWQLQFCLTETRKCMYRCGWLSCIPCEMFERR